MRLHVALQLFWLIIAFWFELGVFLASAVTCNWPHVSTSGSEVADARYIMIIADPQILDANSYPGRAHSLVMLSQYIVDLYLRKSWRTMSLLHPDMVIFLGDMMDNGRAESGLKYDVYYSRFMNIFKNHASIPFSYLPGNHDTGLGSLKVASGTRRRYASHFGPLNQKLSVANHTLLLIDAPGLVDEDYGRTARKLDYHHWEPRPGGTVEFLNNYRDSRTGHEHTVLFTHIPLSRPEGSSCGPHREKGTIHSGGGQGYQNTLGDHASNYVLDATKPSVIFSGDDHDMCEYTHVYAPNDASKEYHIPEITVKSFSMAMGIRRPGLQLLTLVPPSTVPKGSVTFGERMCLLPDQLGIYLHGYIPLLILSLFLLAVSNWRRVRGMRAIRPSLSRVESQMVEGDDSDSWTSLTRRARMEGDKSPFLPWAKLRRTLFGRSRRRRNASFLIGFCCDVRDVAVYPLFVFFCTTFWAFMM